MNSSVDPSLNTEGEEELFAVSPNEEEEIAELEQAVLGCLLLNPREYLPNVAARIKDSDFYYTGYQKVFSVIKRLDERGITPDPITVFTELSELGLLSGSEEITASYLNNLALSVPMQSQAMDYAAKIKEYSKKRKIISQIGLIQNYLRKNRGLSSRDLLAEIESRISNLMDGTEGEKDLQHIRALFSENMEMLERLEDGENKDGITGVRTGLVDLDERTAGLQPGDLIIVAGRPSMGKTGLSINIASHVAIEEKLPVLFFSLEMPAPLISMRVIGSEGRIDLQNFRKGRLKDSDYGKIGNVFSRADESEFYVNDQSGLTTAQVRACIRRFVQAKKVEKLGLVVVDYIQLMSAGKSGAQRAEVVSEISRDLKKIAREFNVPLIALSQLNRALEQRPNKRPIMSDLKESGGIEQDADVILFVYRDEVYNPDSMDKGTAEIIIGKQRNGPIGTVRATFFNEFTKFDNFAGVPRDDDF